MAIAFDNVILYIKKLSDKHVIKLWLYRITKVHPMHGNHGDSSGNIPFSITYVPCKLEKICL